TALEAASRVRLRLRARAVQAVAHEDDAANAAPGGLVERAQAVRQTARNVGAAAGIERADPRVQGAAHDAYARQRLDQLARVGVADDGDLVVVAHVGDEPQDGALRVLDLVAAHRPGGVEHDGERERRALHGTSL